jgi:hypothetical protein
VRFVRRFQPLSSARNCRDWREYPNYRCFPFLWFLIVRLAFMEGDRVPLLDLAWLDKALYAEKPSACLDEQLLAHEGDTTWSDSLSVVSSGCVGRLSMSMMVSAVDDACVLAFLPDI